MPRRPNWSRALRPAMGLACLAVVGLWFPQSGAATDSIPSPPPAWSRRGDAVEARHRAFRERLRRYYDDLSAHVKRDAPDLYPELAQAPPAPPRHGYGLLPKLLPAPAPAATAPPQPRAVSSWYSWPWTERKIETGLGRVSGLAHDLDLLASLDANARRAKLATLVREYPALAKTASNIDEHVQYNRLWQAAIAADRAAYDRGTRLHDAAIERQAVLDALDAMAAADDDALATALRTIPGFLPSQPRPQLEKELRSREAELAGRIHAAIDPVAPPPWLRVEHPSPHSWIVPVPVFTDIEDAVFLDAFRQAVESIWQVRDGGDDYRVKITIHRVNAHDLYRTCGNGKDSAPPRCRPPEHGDPIDSAAHAARFPKDGAGLTTGATRTHAIDGVIVLDTNDTGPHLLAHEFGHMLGFRDEYFRGYRDLGADGFQVMEVVAEPDDVMGNPDSGPVRRRQFENLIAAVERRR